MAIFEQIVPSIDNPENSIALLRKTLGISRITATLLVNRGICLPDEAEAFLNPSLKDLHDPFKLLDMKKAVARIKLALSKDQRITVYGDYDVDGMTSSALLFLYLKKLGANVDVYIPDRHDEGYGIHKVALKSIRDRGTDLLISVDCGITAVEEVKMANDLGLDVIITDHHQLGFSLPNAVAVINPNRNPELYSTYSLAGVGVAGKLVQALGGVDELEKYLDLVALGTIADIVPLIGENRVLVTKGLERINCNPGPGIQALIQVSGMSDQVIDTSRVAFGLAPRLNAAGRISDPMEGFKLLAAETMQQAWPLAESLEKHNKLRQDIESLLIDEAIRNMAKQVDLSCDKVIILEGEDWNPGVIGIAASKITETYHRPCILISVMGCHGVGSARSIPGFDIFKALNECSDLFLRFGGHQQAAGLTLTKESIPFMRSRLLEYAEKHIDESMLVPRYYYDALLKPEDISIELADELECLKPFGTGNAPPYFMLDGVVIKDSQKVGKNRDHLKMALGIGQRTWDAIGFGMGGRFGHLDDGHKVSLLAAMENNRWKGISKVQFRVKNIMCVIEDKEDCEEYLRPFHFKFFDAFFAGFLYNKNGYNEFVVADPSTIDPIELDELVSILADSSLGNLVLVNSIEGGRLFLNALVKKGILPRVSIGYGTLNLAEGAGVNGCILAPDISSIPFEYYKRIYLLEKGFPLTGFAPSKPPVFNGSVKEVQVGKQKSKQQWNPEIELKLERADFVTLYRWIKSLVPGRDVWPDKFSFLDCYKKQTGRSINGFQLRVILGVFEELGFTKTSIGDNFLKVWCNSNPVAKPLDESELYRYFKKWYSRLGAD